MLLIFQLFDCNLGPACAISLQDAVGKCACIHSHGMTVHQLLARGQRGVIQPFKMPEEGGAHRFSPEETISRPIYIIKRSL